MKNLTFIRTFSFLMLWGLYGCGGSSETPQSASTSLTLSSSYLAALTDSSLSGGTTIRLYTADGLVENLDLDGNQEADIPLGELVIYLVSFSGPGLWQGEAYCGVQTFNILEEQQEVEMEIWTNICQTDPVFQEIFAQKGYTGDDTTTNTATALFGISQFDNAVFAP